MQDLSNRFAAHVMATLHVFANRERNDRGQAAAEYVGIIVFVAVLITVFLAAKTDVAKGLKDIITGSLDEISNGLGGKD